MDTYANCSTNSGVLDSKDMPVPLEKVIPAIRRLFEAMEVELHHMSKEDLDPLLDHYGLDAFFPTSAKDSRQHGHPRHVTGARRRLAARLEERLSSEVEKHDGEQRLDVIAALHILKGLWQLSNAESISALLAYE